ncbi:MAG: NAD-dependent epimerase/dehydratase family protein [Verrucomicrobia bacterium]|nr:NAD-dependent epimerase/dehydratase family protein [Verrucomicrobiota bacterium]
MDSTLTLDLPTHIGSEAELGEVMTRPSAKLIEFVKTLPSPLLILGVGGKMGPSLAVLVQRATAATGHNLKIIAASRFSGTPARQWLDEREIETIACDLLEREAVRKLPDAPNVIYLVGLKFGTQQNPSLTWAVNTLAPSHVCERFANSRIVALSTGNVYPFSSVQSGGSIETDSLTPLGEYANAAVARERLFEYHTRKNKTPLALLRLNYAVELRYGVLLEIAQKVWANQPVDVTTGYFNCIWQADANELIVRSLDLAAVPPAAFNMTGVETLSVRKIALRFGELLGRSVSIVGQEADSALLSNTSRLSGLLGQPATSLDTVCGWVAHWVKTGGSTLGKPTRFDVRDGKF